VCLKDNLHRLVKTLAIDKFYKPTYRMSVIADGRDATDVGDDN